MWRWMGLIVVLVLVACAAPAIPKVRVEEVWARPAMAMEGMNTSAVYFTLVNEGGAPDALVGASVSSTVASAAEIHETTMEGGVMKMQPVPRVEVPAGGRVEFKPGGYHVMLIGLKQELKVGDTIQVVLRFEKGGEMTVQAQVRAP